MNVKGLTVSEIHQNYFKEQKTLDQTQLRMNYLGGGVTKEEKPPPEKKQKGNDLLKSLVKKGKLDEDEINHFSDDYDEEKEKKKIEI